MISPQLMSAPPRWTPRRVAGCRLWLEADQVVGLSDGAAVASVTDRGLAPLTFAQATGSKQPAWRAAGVNGRPSFEFGGDDLLVRAGAPPFTGLAGAIFVVANLTDVTSVELLASADESGSLTDRLDVAIDAASHLGLNCRKAAGTATTIVGDATLSAGTTYVLSVLSDGAAYSLFVNGGVQSLTVAAGANNGDWFGDLSGAADNLVIGAFKHTSEVAFATGQIAALVYYDQAIGAGQRQMIERRLGRKYGAAVA